MQQFYKNIKIFKRWNKKINNILNFLYSYICQLKWFALIFKCKIYVFCICENQQLVTIRKVLHKFPEIKENKNELLKEFKMKIH